MRMMVMAMAMITTMKIAMMLEFRMLRSPLYVR